ncbi:MAG: hypothetical protein IH840_04655 [Candidatus Heimdallarchaeota archaeon]|nr:hypothetical protein [Candidatus Heimdallarchaeota archaeon]
MRSKRNLMVLIIGFCILSVGIVPVSADYSVVVTLNDAWYEDSDNDGYEDDIILILTLELFIKRAVTKVDLYVGVQLPSGAEFWFLTELKLRKSGDYASFDFKFTLFDTATESGWYTAYAIGYAAGDKYAIMDSLEFDPPGSKSGGVPRAIYIAL